MKECDICGRPNSELHHIIFRSECKALEHCKANFKYLCAEHHRGTYSPHGKHSETNKQYKLEFQQWLESVFVNSLYSPGEVQKILNISVSSTEKLLKAVPHKCYLYAKEDILRACMGGMIID